VVLTQHPKVAQLRQALAQKSAIGGMMSGSGPTVFALTQTRSEADRIAEQVRDELNDPDLNLWVTKFISKGIHVVPPD
jgi:4-diphosphocytidyl-2-C-methyl-D-erythritol kinase